MVFAYTVLEFLCGSLMFSYWLGIAAKKDIRSLGDGNPGGFNLWQAAGAKLGFLGILLDFLKGLLPLVFLIEGEYIQNYEIIPVAIAPVLGHAFSPFLRFKGGKAIAVTFGVWSAVTRFEASIVLALILAILKIVAKVFKSAGLEGSEADAVMVTSGMVLLGVYFIFREVSINIAVLWLLNFLLLLYTNRSKINTFFRSNSYFQ